MHISQRLQSLKHDIPNFMMWQFPSLLNQLIDILMQILKNKVQLIILFDQLNELHYIRVM